MSAGPLTIDQILHQARSQSMPSNQVNLDALFQDFDDQTMNPHTMINTKNDAGISAAITNRLIQSLIEQNSTSQQQQQNVVMSSPFVEPSPVMTTPCLDTFSTPFTPAATGFVTESPMMSTPYMDPLMNQYATPFMDASAATPFLDAPDAFDQFFTPMMTPSLTLNDVTAMDPAQLALPQEDNGDDSLFPPLTQEEQQLHQQQQLLQQQQQHQQPGALLHDASPFASPAMPAGASSMLIKDDVTDFDGLFDDLFAPADVFPSNDVQAPHTATAPAPAPANGTAKPKQSRRRRREGDEMVHHYLNLATVDDKGQYLCPLCNRTFRRRYNLGTHLRTHNRERVKPYPCNMCNKAFDRKHDCERHISTVHMGERLFRCAPCKAAFSRRDALHRHHLQKHAGG
ncbi:hypothetical protein BC940DRAFT_293369 [Gongronella butleri]|nr:hypothetical protein BC940DRAFT_293369 [Gongronella butleri]